MALWQNRKLKRINILEGSVSSGKTWISLVLWAFWVRTMPDDKLYMMCAKSLTTLKRNCLFPLQDLVGEDNFSFSINTKEGQLFGRKILFEGANDARSESKIRGLTLQGAYCDELTQFPEDFFTMLLSRLRVDGAKLIGTTNPDSPSHWLKVNYIDRKEQLDLLDIVFLLDDNTTLPQDYVQSIKAEYVGVFYKRFVLGLWCMAEGMIYPEYEKAIERPPQRTADKYVLSCDYGTLNAFAVLLWGHYGNTWYAVDGWYYSGRDTGYQMTDEEYGRKIDEKFGKYSSDFEKLQIIVDPSAASFITELKRKKRYKVNAADNDVMDGIRETASAMYQGLIKISPEIKEWEREAAGYVWDNKSVDERPIKVNDHCLTGETLVMTETGEKKISDLVGTNGNVWSYNTETKQAELKPYTDCRLTQRNASIYRIELADGNYIRCTGEHPILTVQGYKRADELTDNDEIIGVYENE